MGAERPVIEQVIAKTLGVCYSCKHVWGLDELRPSAEGSWNATLLLLLRLAAFRGPTRFPIDGHFTSRRIIGNG